MGAKIPAPRNAKEPDSNCKHKSTDRRGPFTIKLPKGPHKYYQVWCNDCFGWLRNENA